MNINRQKGLIVFSFLIVPILLMLTFSLYPIGQMIFNSFTDWDGFAWEFNFVGLENYIDIIGSGELIEIMGHNLAYIVMGLIVVIISLLIAVLLDSKIKGSNVYRAVFFLPYIVNNVSAGFMYRYIYDYEDGALNTFFSFFGAGGVRWLGNERLVNYSLALVMAWQIFGFFLTVFLGAIQSIDRNQFEAADIDGARWHHKLLSIIIPNMATIIALNMFLVINWSMKAFDQPFILTGGGPAGASDTFVLRTIQLAFQYQNYGKASAMGVTLLGIVLIITYFQRRSGNKGAAK